MFFINKKSTEAMEKSAKAQKRLAKAEESIAKNLSAFLDDLEEEQTERAAKKEPKEGGKSSP
ncbi:MAG: hypothetical protein SFV32_09595 [Opitutaceae bacterium]|nr:hypothetical protein [Opitutaceae bacterium]